MNKALGIAAALALALPASAVSFEKAVEGGQLPPAADAFAGVASCTVLDLKTFVGFSLDEAQETAEPCVRAALDKYRAAGGLKAGFIAFGSEYEPAPAGLLVETDLPLGSQGLRDFEFALARRENRLLGHVARLLRRGEAAPAPASSIQAALDGCILAAVVRVLRSGQDFVDLYGRCLLDAKELGITAVRGGSGLSVVVESGAKDELAAAYDGYVTVDPGTGPATFMILSRRSDLERR